MSSYINTFLRTEITCIPQILDKYVGKYYNNKLTNGATWICVIWIAIHLIFDECINVLLKKMHFKEYVRKRMKQSLWNIGFFSVSFIYCTATLYKNNVELFNVRRILNFDWEVVPGQYILGFILLETYFVHATIWKCLKQGISFYTSSYLCLSIFMLCAYFTKKIELAFLFVAIISFSRTGIELSKFLINIWKLDTYFYKYFCRFMLCISVAFFVFTHLIILPMSFIAPLTYSLIKYPSSTSLWALNLSLWLWISSEFFINPLFKMIQHWIYHHDDNKRYLCAGTIVECSLFLPRDDLAFNILIMRQEIKEREAKMMSLRKPKNRNMVIQTLKCMVAIKKKINEKRLSESSDSDDSEISESVNENNEEDEEEKENRSEANSENDDEEESESDVENEEEKEESSDSDAKILL